MKMETGQNFTETLSNNVTLEMIAIPAGKFLMGSNEKESEQPIHQVKLEGFYMSKYPITQAQYQAVMGNNPSRFTGKKNPVENVSWCDAVEFCRQLSEQTRKDYRLPSEAQWEYACRAGSNARWCFGDDESLLGEYAWYEENSNSQTHAVGQKKPNQWGLYDLHGHVFEWCADDWHDNYQNTPINGSVWINGPHENISLLRGGALNSKKNRCRSADRSIYSFNFFSGCCSGFRVVCIFNAPLD